MKIQKYRFGKMTIDKQSFTSDLLIGADKIYPNWRRKQGHVLVMADIELLLDQIKSDIFLRGTGYFGRISFNLLKQLVADIEDKKNCCAVFAQSAQ